MQKDVVGRRAICEDVEAVKKNVNALNIKTQAIMHKNGNDSLANGANLAGVPLQFGNSVSIRNDKAFGKRSTVLMKAYQQNDQNTQYNM